MPNDQNLPETQDATTEISETELVKLISKIEKLPRSQQRTILRELIDRIGRDSVANLLDLD